MGKIGGHAHEGIGFSIAEGRVLRLLNTIHFTSPDWKWKERSNKSWLPHKREKILLV